MKKKYLKLLLIALTCFHSDWLKAQTSTIDSLKIALDASQNSQERVVATFDLLKEFRHENRDSALILVKENLLLAQKIGDRYYQAKSYQQLGLIYRSLYQYEEAISSYSEGLKITANDTFDLAHADILNSLAYALGKDGQDSLSIVRRQESIPIYLEKEDFDALFWSYFNMGVDSKRVGRMTDSQKYLDTAERIADSMGYRDYIPYVKNTKGNLLSDLGFWSKAMEEYQAGLKIAEELEIEEDVSLLMGNLAIVHKDLGDFEKAENYYLKVLEIELRNEVVDVHYVMYNLGTLNMEREMYHEAIPYLIKSLVRREEIGLKGLQLSSAAMLAEAYYSVDRFDSSEFYIDYVKQLLPAVDALFDRSTAFEELGNIYLSQGKLNSAEEHLTQAYLLNKELDHKEHIFSSAESLYKLHRKKGNEIKALEFLEESKIVKESLINKEQVRAITKLEESYKHDKEIVLKESEIELLKAKDELARLRLFLFIGIALIILIVGFFIARNRVRIKSIQAKQLKETSDFKEAMTGMIAHDLKNPLSVIMNGNEESVNKRMASQMLHLVNNMLDVQKFESNKIVLKKEEIAIQKLFDGALSQVRPLIEQNGLTLNLELESTSINVDKEIMERVLINLLTNAIKYSPKNKTIGIEALKESGRLVISISDQGDGIPKDKIAGIFESFEQFNPKASGGIRSTGLGLSFVKLALEAHGTNIQVDSVLGKGTSFSFQLPLTGTQEKIKEVGKNNSIQFSKKEIELISKRITLLRKLNVYQIGEIEKGLEALRQKESENVSQWVNQVLDTAYSGNEEKYKELLDEAYLMDLNNVLDK